MTPEPGTVTTDRVVAQAEETPREEDGFFVTVDEDVTDAILRLLDAFPTLAGTWSGGGGEERLNRRWREFAELEGDEWLDGVHPDDRPALEAAVSDTNVAPPDSFRLRHGGGYSQMSAHWVDLEGRGGEPIGRLCVCVEESTTNGAGLRADLTDLIPGLAEMIVVARESSSVQRRIQRQANQLRGLTHAAIAINTHREINDILDEITRTAAELIGARQGVTSLTVDDDWAQSINATYLAEEYAAWRDYDEQPTGEGIYSLVCRENRPMRLTQRELERHPAFRGFSEAADRHPPLRGWLAAPLASASGDNIGLVQLSDKRDGEFTQEDEDVLVQLAQLASVALENARLRDVEAEQEVARFRDEMMAGLSHDMQTPVAAIVGLADMLAEHPDIPAEDRVEIYTTLARQAHALRSLVQQFLDFSRIEARRRLPLNLDLVDVVSVIERVLDRFSHEREFVVGHPRRRPIALADRDRLEQVLVNLVSNAVRYSDGPIRVVAGERRGRVVIDVVDAGPGIDDEDIERLFGKFQRGSHAADIAGTGLGLYVTRAIVEAHGGKLSVVSTPGIGSRFTVELDRAAMGRDRR
jgi:signal transduction histidine kinase